MNEIEISSFKLTLGQFIGILGIIVAIIIFIVGTIITIVLWWIPRINNRKQKINNLYNIIWKRSSKLETKDIFIFEDFKTKEYYYRDFLDDYIKEKISNNKNLLIIGQPLSGKTRAIYQNLKDSRKDLDVIIPIINDIEYEDIIIPRHFPFWRKRILVLDDLNKFIDKKNTEYLIRKFYDESVLIIANCRSGFEFEILKTKINLYSVFKNNIIEIPLIDKKYKKDVAKVVLEDPSQVKDFDGNIGTLIYPLYEMEKRFEKSKIQEKHILKNLLFLYLSGIYREREIFSIDRLKLLCSGDVLKEEDELYIFLNKLEFKGFLKKINKNEVWVNETYLERIVKEEYSKPILDIFNKVIDSFSNDPEALFLCGNRAYDLGLVKGED